MTEETRYSLIEALDLMKCGVSMTVNRGNEPPYEIEIHKVENTDKYVFLERRRYGDSICTKFLISADDVMEKETYFTLKE